MIQLSRMPFKTTKSSPKWSDNKSTEILLKAWFIRQVMAWVYTYTTLWLKVLENIKKIVREEMDGAWCFEVYMPGLSPREIWDKTGRWEIDDYFSLEWHSGKEYRLNPTHEELVVPLMIDFINSYKDSDTCVYQIKDKYRNEKRAKSGLLRWRDFIMKDAYSFHIDEKDFEEFYASMQTAYMNVYKRVWLWDITYITKADGWVFTDKYSLEFQTLTNIWEDTIYIDEKTWETFNQEIAPAKVKTEFNNENEEKKSREDIIWEGLIWVENLTKFLDIEVERTTKTILFEDDKWWIIAAAIRWDYDINEIKLRDILRVNSLKLLSEEKVKDLTWAEVGYAWVLDLPKWIKAVWDDSCQGRINFEIWANKTNYHSININFWVDLETPEKFYDFKDAKLWDKNPITWNTYRVEKASEVWNIFPLETKYTKPFNMKFTDENNKEVDVIMWCYGIWVSRLMWVVAECFLDWYSIAWPESIAPADYYIIVMGDDNMEKAINLAKLLESDWKKVIIDDRKWKKFGFGQKAWDAELFWVPNRIVISPKTLEKWWYELKKRWEEERIVSF